MNTLQEIIPEILIPHVPRLRTLPSRPSDAGFAPLTAPPEHHVPYWILHCPTLADSMMQNLRGYLQTAPGGNTPPSPYLKAAIDRLPDILLDTPAGELRSEETTSRLWDACFFDPIIRDAVREVDGNNTRPSTVEERTLYNQTPDALICPSSGAPPRLHREDKSWFVFDRYAPDILDLAQHIEEGQLGTSLALRTNEQDARSIIMKMGVSMIGKPDPIPYGILFGGHKFMLFSLFRSADTIGEVRYGLACSNIIDSTSTATPLIPLVIYTLLGNTVQLHQTAFTIPPVLKSLIQDSKPVTQNGFKKFVPLISSKIVIIHTPPGGVSRSFMLYREPDASKPVASPVGSVGPLMPLPSDSTALAETSVPGADFFTPSSVTPVKIPPNEQAIEDPSESDASLVSFEQIYCEISLTEFIGHGAAGQVFIGTVGDEKYAAKIAPWKDGRQILRREADIYEVLSDLQGRCIPKIYGFFGSEHLKALIMTYMGCTVENISNLNTDQRLQLLEELCLIHEYGVAHGDLRADNIALQNGSDAHFIDFSHAYKHQCTGRTTCFELMEARRFLLLTTTDVV